MPDDPTPFFSEKDFIIYTDGSSFNNPGPAGSGVFIRCGLTGIYESF